MSAEFTEDAEERIREIVREEARHLGLIHVQGASQQPMPQFPSIAGEPVRDRLTVDDVRFKVERIRAMAGDDEGAHAAQDDLYDHVLNAIATGLVEDPAAVALAALQAGEIEFQRWCA